MELGDGGHESLEGGVAMGDAIMLWASMMMRDLRPRMGTMLGLVVAELRDGARAG